jgi:hypothetical protein
MNRYKRGFLSGLVFTSMFFILNFFFTELNSWYFYVILFLIWFGIAGSKWWEDSLIEYSKRKKKDKDKE